MKDEHVEHLLKTYFTARSPLGEDLKDQIKRDLYQKQAKRDTFLLCFIQVAMFVMTLAMVATAFIVDLGIISTFIIVPTVSGALISTAVVLIHFKNTIGTRRMKSYE